MKIIHCADIHIGAPMKELTTEKTKLRRREILDTFFGMLHFASNNDVRVVIIAGDLFDKKTIAQSVRKEIFGVIEKNPSVDVVYLTGNHDPDTLSCEDEAEFPANLKRITGSEWVYLRYGDVCIAGFDIETQKSGEGFYEKLRLDKDCFNIVVMHGEVKKEIAIERLRNRNIDYLALGHIHMPDITAQKLDARGVFGYSGSLEGHGFDELGARGFFVLDTSGLGLKRSFVPFARRRYEGVALDITGLESHTEIDERLKEATQDIDSDSIVRVELVGKRKAQLQLEREHLELKLREQFFYAKIKDNTTLESNGDWFGSGVSLGSEFVKLVKASTLEAELKDKVLEYGIKALCGEDIEL